MVAEGEGVLSFSIRDSVRDEDDILGVNWPYVAAVPHLTTLYSMGMSNLAPERLMTLIKFKPDLVLVTGGGLDDSIPSVAMGTTFLMHEPNEQFSLVVAALTPGYFTLVDKSQRHDGSVTYGAFKDSAGELWIFEECVGDFFTSPSRYIGLNNSKMVEPTLKTIQAAITAFLGSEDTGASGNPGGTDEGEPCPGRIRSKSESDLNSMVETGVAIQTGDVITIHASGVVTLGIFAGQSGPEGIQFNPAYSYFPDSPHGCLVGRIRPSPDEDSGSWFLIGTGVTFTAETSGTLDLEVNDNDPGNNTGDYHVEITVCSPK